jgi:hypothetical protein
VFTLPIPVEFKRVKRDDFLADDERTNQKHFHTAVVAAVIKTDRFSRARGTIVFQPLAAHPRDLVPLGRMSELLSVLLSGQVVKLTGDPLTDDEIRAMCKAVLDHKWMLPPASSRPQFAPLSVLK